MTDVGLVAVTAAGRRLAERLADALPGRVVAADTAAEGLRTAWDECDAVVAVLAVGAVTRILAPLVSMGDKHADPAVVVVDEAGRFAVPLLGGHAAGANDLAERVGELLGATPVVTTATDATGRAGLDTLGLPVEGDVANVTRRLLDGERVTVRWDVRVPVPSLGQVLEADGAADVAVTDRLDADAAVVLRPPSLVVGMGASRGVPLYEARTLLHDTLADAGLSAASVTALATADVKADEDGLVALAAELGVPLVTHPADALAAVDVPTPSEVVRAAVGTPSVAEAAALLTSGGELVVRKRASAMATVAVARRPVRGRLAVVGLGPGDPDLLTPRARDELRRASVIVGLDQYVDQVRHLLRPGTHVDATGLGQEEQRAHAAVRWAQQGHAVALIGSGDAGVYAMASPALEAAGDDIDVVGVPGVTAALAASAVLGAPLGHDHCYLSLSDLHTPWPVIERRATAAAEADIVLLCYNPRSAKREWQLGRVVELLRGHRPPSTPVGVVRNASRPDETHWLGTLADFDPAIVDMYSLVVFGASSTRLVAGRMVTPRGYRWAP